MNISIRGIVKESWVLFKKYWKQVYVVLILAMIVNGIGNIFTYDAGGSYTVSPVTAAQYESGEISLEELRFKADFYEEEQITSSIGAIVEALENGEEIDADSVAAEVESNAVTVEVPESGNFTLAMTSFIISLILSFIVGAYALLVYLSLIRGSKTPLKDGKSQLSTKTVLQFFSSGFVVGLVIALIIGLFAFVGVAMIMALSGLSQVVSLFLLSLIGFFAVIYVSIRLYFTVIVSVDEKVWPIKAVKISWGMTKGNMWPIIKLGIMAMLLVIAGMLALFVGLLIAIPVVTLMTYVLYERLAGASSKEQISEIVEVAQEIN